VEGLRILVTGGAGFIGSHLVDVLLSKNNKVIVYDNFDKYYLNKEKNIQHNLKESNFSLIKADILNYKNLLRSIKGVDIVFHMAAQPGVRVSMENPEKTTQTNILGTLNVLKAAKAMSVKRVVFASSSSVYGTPQYLPLDEKHPTNPLSIYGASKLAGEKYCKIFNAQIGLSTVILRYFTVYGPRQRPDMAFHKWVKAIFENEPLRIYGDGNQTRDFTFINDVIDGTIKAAEVDDADGEVFNIGGGSRHRINDIIKLLTGLLGVDDAQIIYESEKLGDVKDTHADITKAKNKLGYKPTVNMEEGLKQFISWYKKVKRDENDKESDSSSGW